MPLINWSENNFFCLDFLPKINWRRWTIASPHSYDPNVKIKFLLNFIQYHEDRCNFLQ